MSTTNLRVGVSLPLSDELIRDGTVVDWELALGLREPTVKEVAKQKRWQARRDRLRKAGLLDDGGYSKKATECPARTTLGNYDSTDDVRCERKVGHKGEHRYLVEWAS